MLVGRKNKRGESDIVKREKAGKPVGRPGFFAQRAGVLAVFFEFGRVFLLPLVPFFGIVA